MYQIGRCLGPCVKGGLVSEEDYKEQVNFVRLFLQGKDRQVIASMVEKMELASQQLAFEKAATYRDQIQALRRVQEQQFVSHDSNDDMDVIGIAHERGNGLCPCAVYSSGQDPWQSKLFSQNAQRRRADRSTIKFYQPVLP